MLSGKRPFARETSGQESNDEWIVEVLYRVRNEVLPSLGELDPSLPDGLVKVVEKVMAKKPADRFLDAHAFIEALKECSGYISAASGGWEAPVGVAGAEREAAKPRVVAVLERLPTPSPPSVWNTLGAWRRRNGPGRHGCASLEHPGRLEAAPEAQPLVGVKAAGVAKGMVSTERAFVEAAKLPVRVEPLERLGRACGALLPIAKAADSTAVVQQVMEQAAGVSETVAKNAGTAMPLTTSVISMVGKKKGTVVQ